MCQVPTKNHRQGINELSTDEISNAIEQLKAMDIKNINLIGAEPLLRKDIFTIIGIINNLNILSSLTTNGVLLSPSNNELLIQSGVETINISIDSATSLHNEIRGRTIINTISNNIKSLVALRKKNKSKNPKINIHTTLFTDNVSSISEMIHFCEHLEIESWSIQYFSETHESQVNNTKHNGVSVASTRFIPQKSSLRVTENQMDEYQKNINSILKYRGPLQISHRAVTILSESNILAANFPIKKCYWIHSHIIIDPYGNIYPCSNIDQLFYGNFGI